MDPGKKTNNLMFYIVPGLYAGSNYFQSHVLVDMWMLTVKLVDELSNFA